MKLSRFSIAAACILLCANSFTYATDDGEGFSLFSSAKLYGELRPRYEHVDMDDGVNDTANAFTARTVLGGQFEGIAGVDGLNAQLEVINITNFGLLDDYFPEQTGFDTINDPQQTRMTQANLSYTFGDTTLIAGRKMLFLDNYRFIGHKNWRQMPQTFDLLAMINKSITNLTLVGAYVNKINYPGYHSYSNTNSVVLNANYKLNSALSLTGYGYMLASIHDTFGVRLTGTTEIAGAKINYEADFAMQDKPSFDEDSMGNIKPDHEAIYYKLGANTNYNGIILGAYYEVLGEKEGTEGGAFSTPLSSLHIQNGFADKFLKTPDDGLVDMSINIGYHMDGIGKFLAMYHNFESDNGGKDFGQEFDFLYLKKVSKNFSMMVTAAIYQQGDLAIFDTKKYWLMLDYKF
jgi:hypothetical protein